MHEEGDAEGREGCDEGLSASALLLLLLLLLPVCVV